MIAITSRPKTAPITPPAQLGNPLPPLRSCAEALLLLLLLYGQYVSTFLPYLLPKIPSRELLVHDDGVVVVAPPSELTKLSVTVICFLPGLYSLATYPFRHEVWHFVLTPFCGIIFILEPQGVEVEIDYDTTLQAMS